MNIIIIKLQYLRMMVGILLVLIVQAFTIRVEEKQYFLTHLFDPMRYLYMDQMGYSSGKGVAEFEISYYGTLKDKSIEPHIYIGLLHHQKFEEFDHERTCRGREKLLSQKQYVPLNNRELSKIKIQINQTDQTLIDFYLYNCQRIYQTDSGDMTLYIKVSWDLNYYGSHLSSKQDILPYYYFITWIILTIFNFSVLRRYCKFQNKPPVQTWVLLIPVVLWLSHTFKLVYLVLHCYTGGYFLLSILNQIVYSISQNLMITLLLVMAFGWTVTFIKDIKDSAAPLGGSLMIINVLTIVFKHLLEDTVHKNHIYDSICSYIQLLIKIGLALIFLIGVVRSYLQTNNIKSQNFLKSLGFYGFIYLFNQPLIALFGSLFIGVQYQNQTMVIASDVCHLIASIIIAQNVISFSSDYAQLDFNHNVVFRSYDPLKQF